MTTGCAGGKARRGPDAHRFGRKPRRLRRRRRTVARELPEPAGTMASGRDLPVFPDPRATVPSNKKNELP